MADTFTKEKRSQIMRQVKSSRNKSTELKLIQFFKDNSIKGWRRNFKLFGKPDFVFPLTKKVVFVDGCFWRGHNCRNTTPKDNEIYWQQKISRNKKRDKIVTTTITTKGWTAIRILECQLNDKKTLTIKFTQCALQYCQKDG